MSMARNYWTDPLTWAGNAGIFVFGIVLSILGGLLPALFERASLDPAEAGSLFLFLNLGSFLVTVLGGPAFDRIGYRMILAACAFSVAAGLWVMAGATDYARLVVAAFLMGLGGGGLNVGTNALISDLYPTGEAVALNRLGIFFGIGTCFIPFLIGILLEGLGVAGVLHVTAVLAAIPGLLFLSLSFPASKHSQGFPVEDALKLLKNPYILVVGVLLFFQSGNEITTSGWLTTYLVADLGIRTSQAAFYLSTFWAAVVVGRLLASWSLGKFGGNGVIRWGALGAAAGVLLLLLFPGLYLAYPIVALIGFSMAPIFPTVMGMASGRFPSFSGTVLGVLIGMALLGGMSIPWLAGVLVGRLGEMGALLLPIAGFSVVFLIQSILARRF